MKKNMKKVLLTALIILSVGTVGCGSKTDEDVTIIGGADGPTSIFLASKTEAEVSYGHMKDGAFALDQRELY